MDPAFVDDPYVKDGFQQCNEFDPGYPGLSLKYRIIIHQKGLYPGIIRLAGVYTLQDLSVTFQEKFTIHRRNEVDRIIRIIS
jgi:hypothetical protein